ncbi:MAG: peptidylprolyl isomerase [Methylovulum sp.]|jgi:FKBP-type peptidyl-prolyl cis-trans isomerase SlyD|nr:peptidylprolyl isomerase [Methylovulum sp.]
MQVTDNIAVTIHFTLTDDDGEIIDSSIGEEPMTYLHGSGQVITGLEKALHGKAVGEKFTVRIEPEDAYGIFSEDRIEVIPRDMFDEGDVIEVGMQFEADVAENPAIVTIVAVEGDNVTIDSNHPLADVALTFEVEIIGLRPATEAELEHGHVHGEACHH